MNTDSGEVLFHKRGGRASAMPHNAFARINRKALTDGVEAMREDALYAYRDSLQRQLFELDMFEDTHLCQSDVISFHRGFMEHLRDVIYVKLGESEGRVILGSQVVRLA